MTAARGFTNVEILVIVGCVTVLFIGMVLAIDPSRRLSQARDAARRRDAREILAAITAYSMNRDGAYPSGIDADPETFQVLGTDASGCDAACPNLHAVPACLDLSGDIGRIPFDTLVGTGGMTGYAVNVNSQDAVEVAACAPELAASISVRR
ncbi:hypothetical protein A2856_04150 [Candidatus Uhrbacteria bacterium RIFCSPHIGHO2_01_FULL_63_20]|uniref:Type II secretion system protein GspG C-terminal domain-containing protein n=1 Tax=Candidatus Uhrbacteria bacterium RIFCSPHIGHO2_01_FULL_63_20 TaxID=1802385 RepID=A0A1F7TML5_9BACT|nr:MAG: hypothetical protein A2856_04150 [Candidatus Uhrbacteria bacterium RIFCSPHIGHO2_01_FULL_63_20]